jgi:hypothetical protein
MKKNKRQSRGNRGGTQEEEKKNENPEATQGGHKKKKNKRQTRGNIGGTQDEEKQTTIHRQYRGFTR